ncbi:MAG: ATP-binding protein [Nitrospiraceae bacterium]|nr:ATP-binding protein [Nitrospiraceae bacterium]
MDSKLKTSSPLSAGLKVLSVIIIVEFLIMAVFHWLNIYARMYPAAVDLTDAFILSIVSSIAIYFWVVKPSRDTIAKIQFTANELERSNFELEQTKRLTKSIIDSMPEAISLLDTTDFSIVWANSTFLRAYGDEPKVMGKHCYEITHHRPDVCSPPNDICPLMETVRTGGHATYEHVHYGKKGGKIYVEVSTSPVRDEKGDIVQVVHVQRDITERKLIEQNLEKSNRELEQFAYTASHDLKSPVVAMAADLKSLERRNRDKLDQESIKLINGALHSAFRMQSLITGLLTYARLSTPAIEKAMGPVNMGAILDAVQANLKADCEKAGCAIVRHGELPELPAADPVQMTQLLQNLLSNAIKFSGKGPSTIVIGAERKKEEWFFHVKDYGIGIPPEHRERIFGLFQRVSAVGDYEGTGMGLAICKKIVERHGGRI